MKTNPETGAHAHAGAHAGAPDHGRLRFAPTPAPQGGHPVETQASDRKAGVSDGISGLPGISVGGRLAGPKPRDLLATGALLLAGVAPGQEVNLATHRHNWGPIRHRSLANLIADAESVNLAGAGGAGFPTARKLSSMVDQRVSHVIINGAEGESASGKDGALLAHVPHLVLDGAVVAAAAMNSPRVVIRISEDRPDLISSLPSVLAARSDAGIRFELSVGPAHFVAGEATAVIRAIAGGPALPADLGRPPALPRRLPGRAPLVFLSNVETFARLAVASRGHHQTSALMSLSGAVAHPGIIEMSTESTLAEAAFAAGWVVGDPTLLITGGWHGKWVTWNTRVSLAALTRASIESAGGRWGAGAFIWVPQELSQIEVLAAVAQELAAGTAGQCGPCWQGLPELASMISRGAANPESPDRSGLTEVLSEVDGRGICAHPSASVSAIRSALEYIDRSAS